MDKIIAYVIAEAGSTESLGVTVTTLMTQGWQPFGNLFIEDNTTREERDVLNQRRRRYCQPLVKYESQKP